MPDVDQITNAKILVGTVCEYNNVYNFWKSTHFSMIKKLGIIQPTIEAFYYIKDNWSPSFRKDKWFLLITQVFRQAYKHIDQFHHPLAGSQLMPEQAKIRSFDRSFEPEILRGSNPKSEAPKQFPDEFQFRFTETK